MEGPQGKLYKLKSWKIGLTTPPLKSSWDFFKLRIFLKRNDSLKIVGNNFGLF